MAASSAPAIPIKIEATGPSDLRTALQAHRSKELVFAVVGYAGSGTSFVANQILKLLQKELGATGFHVLPLKARKLLDEYAAVRRTPPPTGASRLQLTAYYQGVGDDMRRSLNEHGAVAAYAVRSIQKTRTEGTNERNVFILDSLKHPAEVDLLRNVYGDAFCLVGVGCRPDVRNGRLARKYELDEDAAELAAFIDRDAEDSEQAHGQQVNRTFHLADYFVDNTHDSANRREYGLPDQIKRLFDILFTTSIRRPNRDERGIYAAHSAALRSACLSRQVGAAILDDKGMLLAVGTNEVPRHGGGAYDGSEPVDHRCFASRHFCSNSTEQDKILKDVFHKLSIAKQLATEATEQSVMKALRKSRIKALIEFSRSVHAEMDALISLARSGTRLPLGSSLFTTTYPCHSCARHIVSAGIERVIYLEPYSKSMAIDLHADSIADNLPPEDAQGRVRFVPYQGVSPNLYRRVYLKTGDLKDGEGRMLPVQRSERGLSSLWKKSYTDLEQDVVQFVTHFEESQYAKT
jgi:deoxycytidylate deaminase